MKRVDSDLRTGTPFSEWLTCALTLLSLAATEKIL